MKRDLSKSRLMSFIQCPRRLWLEIHQPQLAEQAEIRSALDIGREVGEIARTFYPRGILVGTDGNLASALQETAHLMARRSKTPIFEAAFQHDGIRVRADLLVPGVGGWNLVEVKSSTSIKEHYLSDVTIQAHVLQASGVPLRRMTVLCINKDFVYPGGGCYHLVKRGQTVHSLFVQQDVTAEMASLIREAVPQWIRDARRTLAGKKPPRTHHCKDPYPCPFLDHCYPPSSGYPLEGLPRIQEPLLKELHRQGYQDIRDIPEGVLKHAEQERVRRVTANGKAELLPEAAKRLTAQDYPRFYIDFETIQFAAPVWTGTRPYEQLPFQWSCHIERRTGALEHAEFLDLSGSDPARAFAEALLKTLEKKGPVFVYNQAFEGVILKALGIRFNDLAPALRQLASRFVDLYPLTRKSYCHPDMRGSWSIKAVLPTLAPDLDYANLGEVQNGGGAQDAYREAIAPGISKKRKMQLERALREYCQRDTEALVRLAGFLQGTLKRNPASTGRRKRTI
ncbi:MAG: DUF2779 domain-containing protein [Gammaproteobacteria bacterium]